MSTETWRPVEGFARYEVSDAGNVRSLPHVIEKCDGRLYRAKGRMLRQGAHSGGYRLVTLYETVQCPISHYVHRLVASAFIPNPGRLPEINHKNLDKTDNRVENLEWCSASGNRAHATDNGLYHGRTNPKFHRKLTPADVDAILQMSGSSETVGEQFGVSGTMILHIRNGRRWQMP